MYIPISILGISRLKFSGFLGYVVFSVDTPK